MKYFTYIPDDFEAIDGGFCCEMNSHYITCSKQCTSSEVHPIASYGNGNFGISRRNWAFESIHVERHEQNTKTSNFIYFEGTSVNMVLSRIRLKNSALLIIDVINSCCSPKCESKEPKITFKKIRKMVPKLVAFIKKYKEGSENPVIYINCTPWNKEHLTPNIIELYKDPNCRYYSKDKTGFNEAFYGVTPDKDDVIITKNSCDAFTNPALDRILKKRQIKYIIVAGVFGDGCVHSTIQGGFSKGYNFIILKDLIETTDVKIRQNLQKLLKCYTWPVMFGKTITSEEFLKNS